MATKTVTQVVCDRCDREIKDREGEERDETLDVEPAVYIARPGLPIISFVDLCKKCDKRVASLIADIGLSAAEAKDDDHDEDEDEDGDILEEDDMLDDDDEAPTSKVTDVGKAAAAAAPN